MNKAELVTKVASSTGRPQSDVNKAVTEIFDAIAAALAAGEKVAIPHFGSFQVVHREARGFRNPSTGDSGIAPAHNSVVFKASSVLKNSVQ